MNAVCLCDFGLCRSEYKATPHARNTKVAVRRTVVARSGAMACAGGPAVGALSRAMNSTRPWQPTTVAPIAASKVRRKAPVFRLLVFIDLPQAG